jgi:ubiquinol-cytochrome c reductase cytochrome b subunit
MKPADETLTQIARGLVVVYFAFFVVMLWYTQIDRTKPVPNRVRFHEH